jgi:CO/xanthine dehydrogenase FAD-binding subunit
VTTGIGYLYPASIAEAVALLAAWDGRARIIAGGTDLMPAMQLGRCAPECLVDVTRIPGLDLVEVGDRFVLVGAAVTFARLRSDPFLRARVPALVEAAASVGAAPLQSVATWAGNIAQAMPAADGAVVAVALGAEACVASAAGARWAAVESLYCGPKTSALDPTRQMISHLRFPLPGPEWGCAWQRAGRRRALILPTLNCASTVQLSADGSRILSATLALGPVAQLPFRVRAAEAALLGQEPAEVSFDRAALIAQTECRPRSSPFRASREYRQALIPVMVHDCLAQATRRAQEEFSAQ